MECQHLMAESLSTHLMIIVHMMEPKQLLIYMQILPEVSIQTHFEYLGGK